MPLHLSPPQPESLARYLEAIECFAVLDRRERDALGRTAALRTFAADAVIFQEGDASLGLWILQQGGVKITRQNADGGEQILHLLGPGDYFNLVGALDAGPAPGNAVTLILTTAWFLPASEIRAAVRRHPPMALAVIDMLTRRLRNVTQHLEDLTLYPVRTRLARYLLGEASHPGAASGIVTRVDIAGYLGTTPETISRTLAKLQDDGAIRFDRHRVIITDADRLRSIAML